MKSAIIIDGRKIAAHIRTECCERVRNLKQRYNVVPGLAVIVVGDNPASAVYVSNKVRACTDIGIRSTKLQFPSKIDPAIVIDAIAKFNSDPNIHGILVQLPLPQQFASSKVLQTISADKDVDGFHMYNVGGLVLGETVFPPCTPYGVLRLLDYEGISLEGKNVVIVGASNIVGKPMALMLMQRGATVSICHAKTRDLAQFTILADVLVVAAGQRNLILAEMVKSGAVVIDVGINRLEDGTLVGDVDFERVRLKASHITPVPGGVGPMTVTMLLVNTIVSTERAIHLRAGEPALNRF